MALAETAKLVVDLSLQGNFLSQTSKVNKALSTMNTKLSQTEGRAYKAGQQIGTGIKRGAVLAAAGVGILVTQIGFGLDQLVKLESLTAQTNAVLKSTKGVSGQTAASVRSLAEEFEGLNATIDDKVIQSGENLLLTFTAINKKAFKPALAAALDLSVAMGTDLDSAIKTVGKALSDPAKAVSRLTRQGIILTKSEQKQIAVHLKNNDALGAQNVVLAALNKRYGGSFLAGGNTTAGKVAKFGDAIEDLQKNLATALLPAIGHIADALNELFRDPQTIAAVEKLGVQIGKLFSPENIRTGIGILKSGFAALRSIAGPIADVVGAAVKAFASLPPEIKTLLVGGFAVNKITGGLVTNIFGGIAEAIAKSFIKAPLVNVQGAVVNVGGGIPGGGGVPGGGAAGLTGLAALTIGGGAVAASIVGAVNSPLWVRNTTLSAKLEQQGLTQPERAAQQYYRASAADQAQMRKHILVLPTRADFESGNAKLHAAVRNAATADSRASLQVEQATRRGAATTAAAVRASRPIVTTNVKVSVSGNSVHKVIQVTGRYGQPAGSRNQNNIGVSGAR